MALNTIAGLALACALSFDLSGIALAQSTTATTSTMAGPVRSKHSLAVTTSKALSPNGTGGSNGVAFGSRGAGTGGNLRQPAVAKPGANLAPTTRPAAVGAPPPG